jgi:hypothetical protein
MVGEGGVIGVTPLVKDTATPSEMEMGGERRLEMRGLTGHIDLRAPWIWTLGFGEKRCAGDLVGYQTNKVV